MKVDGVCHCGTIRYEAEVDPAKVVRIALQNASSVASLLITTEAMIADRPAKPAGGGGGGGHGHGGGGMGDMDF